MAALTITTSSVVPVSGDFDKVIAGEAITPGQSVYLKSSDGKWYKAQCDGTADEAGATDCGIAVGQAAAAGQYFGVARDGAVVTLGTGTAGVGYYIGATAGALNPYADLVSTNKVTHIAVGIGSNQVLVKRVYHASAALA